jgi:HAE1 family hydrophobic/amphiphilic exporter-1
MDIVDTSIKRPVTVLMVSLALVMYGLVAYFSLPVSLLPDVDMAIVTVQTVYPGASPDVIETQVTKKIEDQISAITDIDSITSYSMDSASFVIVRFKGGKNDNVAVQEVKDKVEAILADMPQDMQRPSIGKQNINSLPVMSILLEGDMDPSELYTLASTVIQEELAQVTGVGSVNISGGRKREIQVNVEQSAVYERYLPVEQIAGLLARANLELPGGNIELDGQDIPVRFKGEFTSIEEIGDIDIQTQAGSFKLRQLADIRDTETKVRERTIFFDKKAVVRNENALVISIQKNATANTSGIVETITRRLPVIEAAAGGNIHLRIIQEDAGFIRDSVNDTLSNLIMGILLTGLVLLVFLHDWRSTLIITIAMPFSIIATFFVMQLMHIGVNVLSLMGLSCAVGTLVANSVVVLENIFRYKDMGLSRVESASRGTKEVLIAVLASTATNVAVFLPLGGMSGAIGSILSPFAYAIVISTIFSIVVSFTITPLMASRFLPEQVKKDSKAGAALERFFRFLDKVYGDSLKFILKRRRRSALVVLATIAAFALSVIGFTLIEMEMVPNTDAGKIRIDAELPQGSSLDMTASALARIEEKIARYEEVETILTSLGTMGMMDRDVSIARMEINLVPRKERTRSNSVLAVSMIQTLSDIPGVDIRIATPSPTALSDGGAVDLMVQGPDNMVLQHLANELKDRLETVPGIMNLTMGTKAGKDELIFEPDRKQISQDGITVQSIAVTLRTAVDGMVSSVYREDGEEYDIRVKMKDSAVRDIEDIRNIPIVSARGIFPLSRYADISFESGYNMIVRMDKARSVEVSADLLPGYVQGTAMAEAMRLAREIELPQGYVIKEAGQAENMSESSRDMGIVFITAIILVYMLLAAILENFVQPLFILSTIPLSIIGVVASCLLTGTVLNIIALIGIVMLVGIVVNNAILILDYYNQIRREEGVDVEEALIKACPTKLKPILMSNIAIILGLVPMAMGIGESMAEIRQPMGILVIGGIVSSTIMTLWLIPALEHVLARRKWVGGTTK